MNPLYIDSQRVGLGVDGYSLVIKDLKSERVIEKFAPRDISYDSIFIQRPNGFISFAALNWLVKHAVSLTVLNWRGNILAQFMPEEPISNELKLAQYAAYLKKDKHTSIARTIVETKLKRQREILESLSESYPIRVPRVQKIDGITDESIRNQEAKYAIEYFIQFGKVCESIGYEYKRRNLYHNSMHAPDLPNALLNYSYAILQTYVRRAINAIGLDNSIPFLHDLRNNTGLVYDLMELWRTNCDYSVLQTLNQLKRSKRTHFLTDGFEVMLEQETVRALVQKIKFNLSLEELLFNTRIFANFLLGKKESLSFALKPIEVRPLFESDLVKQTVLTKTARELGMNKSTHWYQRKMLRERGSLKLYRNTKQYYS